MEQVRGGGSEWHGHLGNGVVVWVLLGGRTGAGGFECFMLGSGGAHL